jgi:hypothetical protein
MAQNVNATFVKTPNNGAVQISTGTLTSSAVTVYAGGTNGSKIPGFIATGNGTTAAYDVQWGVSSGGTAFYLYGTVSIPVGAGSSDTIPTVNMFNTTNMPALTIDSDGNPFIFLASSAWLLQAKSPATSSTWTTGVVINLIVPSVGDF